MDSKCTWTGIGIEVESGTAFYNDCVKLNREISTSSKESFIFSDSNRPHINLYDLDVPESNLTQIQADLRTLLKNVKSFDIGITGIKSFPFGAIYLEVEKTPQLQELHTKIVGTVSKYKGSCVCSDYLKRNRKYTISQQENLKHYGNPFVLNDFYPHITVGFIKNPQVFLKDLDKNFNESFSVEKIEINNVSIVTDVKRQHRIISEFQLSK